MTILYNEFALNFRLWPDIIEIIKVLRSKKNHRCENSFLSVNNMLIHIKPREREIPLWEDLDPIPSSETETYW